MTDIPQGPGWWLASDGTWHPPEEHPSVTASAASAVPPTAAPVPPSTAAVKPPIPVPEAPIAGSPGLVYTAEAPIAGPPDLTFPSEPTVTVPEPRQQPTWSGEVDRRTGTGAAWTGEERRVEAAPMYPDMFQQAVAGSQSGSAWSPSTSPTGSTGTRSTSPGHPVTATSPASSSPPRPPPGCRPRSAPSPVRRPRSAAGTADADRARPPPFPTDHLCRGLRLTLSTPRGARTDRCSSAGPLSRGPPRWSTPVAGQDDQQCAPVGEPLGHLFRA